MPGTGGSGPQTPPSPATGPGALARRLAAESFAAGDPTGWFERMYAAAEAGTWVVPWDRGTPSGMLVQWAGARGLDGGGQRALVVGCGLGDDAEYIAGLGFDTVAFDISAAAIRTARRRRPRSRVGYVTADLLDPPEAWQQAFDLVVECFTVQALPDPPRRDAIVNIGRMAGPGGTLIVVARARDAGEDPGQGPPWALTRAEIDTFAATGLSLVRIDDVDDIGPPPARRWLAEFRRPGPGRQVETPTAASGQRRVLPRRVSPRRAV
jgi:SAM-dependent methyltransferase